MRLKLTNCYNICNAKLLIRLGYWVLKQEDSMKLPPHGPWKKRVAR